MLHTFKLEINAWSVNLCHPLCDFSAVRDCAVDRYKISEDRLAEDRLAEDRSAASSQIP